MKKADSPISRLLSKIRIWYNAGKYVPWLVLVVFCAGTFFLWLSIRLNTEDEMRTNFNTRANETVMRIEQRMRAYEQVMRGVQGVFASSRSVNRTEFHTYYNSLQLQRNFPGIQGIGYSMILKPEEKDRHLRVVRHELESSYTIRPEGKRGIYTSVIFLEPFSDRNLRAIGFDLYAEEVRHAAMVRAADSGETTITGRLTLVRETNTEIQSGFLMFLPIYTTMDPYPPPPQRRAQMRGWVYATFRMEDLMSGLSGDRESEVDIYIYDGDAITDASLMYNSEKTKANRTDALFHTVRIMEIAGHKWTVIIRSTLDFEKGIDTRKPLFAAIAGTGASILLTLLTMLLVNSRERALDALRVEGRYKNLLEKANDGILVVDMERRIIDANEQACNHFGYSLDEFRTMRLEDLHAPETGPEVIAQFESLKSTGSARFEILGRRKDGTIVTDEISERFVTVGDEEYVLKFVRDIADRKHAEIERERLVRELQAALAEVKTLSGLIPICSSCKKIRDDKGYWNVLESYLIEHSEAQFTHGLCPDCVTKMYPGYTNKTVQPKP
jgi:PAS domain S-box-containing protein